MAGCKFINSNNEDFYLGWASSDFLNKKDVFDYFETDNDLVTEDELIVTSKEVLKTVSDKMIAAVNSEPRLREDLRTKILDLSNFLLSTDTIQMVLV